MKLLGIYQNCRGLKTKSTEFKLNILQNSYDFVSITETWLNSSFNSSEFFDERYKVYRSDSKYALTNKKDGAGSLIAIKNVYPSINLRSVGTLFDDVWVKVPLKCGSSLIICSLYMPCNATFDTYNKFLEYLSELRLTHDRSKFLITGDFNLSCITWSSHIGNSAVPVCYDGRISEALIDTMQYTNLFQFNLVLNYYNRILDLVMSNLDYHNLTVELGEALSKVDKNHPPLSISLNLECVKMQPAHFYNGVNFRKLDYARMSQLIDSVDWEALLSNPDVDGCVDVFYDKISMFIRHCAGSSRSRSSSYPCWFSPKLKVLLKCKEKARSKLKIFKTELYQSRFRHYRDQVKIEINVCFSRYIKDIELNISKQPKQFMNFTKSLTNKSEYPASMNLDEQSSTNIQQICDWFADHFFSVYNSSNVSDTYLNEKFPKISPVDSSYYRIFFSTDDILESIKDLDIDKGGGPDSIPNLFIKQLKHVLVSPLSILYNKSLASGIFPSLWKESFITPVFKKGDESNIKNYRPISLLNSFSKLFERLVHKHIFEFIRLRIDIYQHGFFKKKSTVTNLIEYTDFIYKNIDKKIQVDSIYTDFSAAFDKVNHKILLRKLYNFGISGTLLKWFESYLINRRQKVKFNGHLSSIICPPSGVPQGSILGPLLFLIFINDIGLQLKSNYLLYADDLKIYKPIKSVRDCLDLQKDLDCLHQWCINNILLLNINKCVCISFTRNINKIRFDYTIYGTLLERTLAVKDLGVTFDYYMRFDVHIDNICKKAFKMLGFIIRRGKQFNNPKTMFQLYNSFVRSQVEYATEIWHPYYTSYSERIERVQHKFTKYMCFRFFPLSSYIPYETRIAILNMNQLKYRRIYLNELFLYKILNALVETVELSRINFYIPGYVTRHSQLFLPFSARTNAELYSPINRMQSNHNIYFLSVDLFSGTLLQFKRNILVIIAQQL